jgi:hypothetical protein
MKKLCNFLFFFAFFGPSPALRKLQRVKPMARKLRASLYTNRSCKGNFTRGSKD